MAKAATGTKRASTSKPKAEEAAKAASTTEAKDNGADAVTAEAGAGAQAPAADSSAATADVNTDAGADDGDKPAGDAGQDGNTEGEIGDESGAEGGDKDNGADAGETDESGDTNGGDEGDSSEEPAPKADVVLINGSPSRHRLVKCGVTIEPGDSIAIDFEGDDKALAAAEKEVNDLRALFRYAEGEGLRLATVLKTETAE